jgi:hypothetical protein
MTVIDLRKPREVKTGQEGEVPRWLVWFLRFLAYALPLGFLLYVLYWNFLPFGYDKTFTIDVGSPGDTSGEFYLEPSRNLSERKTAPDGTTYRELNGIAYAVFKPKAVLKNAQITVSVEGEGVSIIPPVIDFNPDSVQWDYAWDFTKDIPSDLVGNAFVFEGEVTFNGRDTRLQLPGSADMFEDGPFTVYAEWTPKNSENNAQQIVGHYNWELWQNKNSVEFRVGRMNDGEGPAYSVKYPVTPEFFNTKHTALASYNPSENGYLDLFVDGNFAGRTYFSADKIWKEYGNQNLSIGWTPHNYGNSAYFLGTIYSVNITSGNILQNQTKIDFPAKDSESISISVISTATSTLSRIQLNAIQK